MYDPEHAAPLTVGGWEGAAPALMFDANPLPMWVEDGEGRRFLAVNDAMVVTYRYSREELLSMAVAELRHPSAGLRAGVERHRRRDGSVLDVEVARSPLSFAGAPAWLVSARDVTTEQALTDAIRRSDDQVRAIFAHAPVAEVTISPDGRVQEANEVFCLLVDRGSDRLVGALFDDLLREGGDFDDRMAAARQGLLDHFQVDCTLIRRGGQAVDVELTASAVRDRRGGLRYLVLLAQDVTEHREAQRQLAERALTDPLTGLPNRNLFLDRLDKGLLRSHRDGSAIAVLFVDVDRFKLVNDTLGHAAGDLVLLALSDRLRHAVTRHDTVARFGGDEFTVLCEGLPDGGDQQAASHAALDIAGRLLQTLGAPLAVGRDHRSLTVSIGVAIARPGDHVTGEFLIQGADSAMYRAKQAGRNRYELFDQNSRSRTVAMLRRADELSTALADGQLYIDYQPLVSLRGDHPPDVEALLRWRHPRLGRLGPDGFIALAEETNLIVPIGSWVIEQACAAVAALDSGGARSRVGVAVNLSARQLASPDLPDVVRGVLADTGLEPPRLCLEITETVLVEDLEWSIDALRNVKALGVRLAIDDFGTGYSSLNYLRRLPVDVVKIDRSFVAGLGIDVSAEAVVAAVVNLSHALGLSVVAEGVEAEEQLVALRALGCDAAQGFYWSPPVPLDELRQALLSQVAVLKAEALDLGPLTAERVAYQRSFTGRSIVLRSPHRLPKAMGDAGAVRTVVTQLLSNAVGFSGKERPVIVQISIDRRWVRISVSDFGVGMTETEVARCFEPFWQGPAGKRLRGGTGIGLYIVRSLVEKMDGHVWVRSSPGKGSTFTVALPRAARTGVAAARPAPQWERGEQTVIQEFMRQLGVPQRREA